MKLALGTVQFGLNYGIANIKGKIANVEANAILNLAKHNGIDTLDTAIAYGESEYRLGQYGITGWNVVTKLSAIPDDCLDIHKWVETAVKDSLKRLKVSNLYGLLLHRPQQLLEKNGGTIYHALEQVRDKGFTDKIGISIYEPEELDLICKLFKLDLVQAPFNILDHRLINSGWIFRLAELGTELHVRSIFLQGLLLMKTSDRPKKFNRWSSIWTEYDNFLDQNEITPLEACIGHAMSYPEISRVVVGVDNRQQLADIILANKRIGSIIPSKIKSNDLDLLNPARWTTLT